MTGGGNFQGVTPETTDTLMRSESTTLRSGVTVNNKSVAAQVFFHGNSIYQTFLNALFEF